MQENTDDWGKEPPLEGQIETNNDDGINSLASANPLDDPALRRFKLDPGTLQAILAGHKATPKVNAIPEPVDPATDKKEG